MKKTKGSSKDREAHRAKILHEVFQRLTHRKLSLARRYALARQMTGGRMLRSQKTFERLFYSWRSCPQPDTIMRKWRAGTPAARAEWVNAVVQFALAKRVSLYAAHRALSLPISYATVLRRANRPQAVLRLSRIERARQRLERAEKIALGNIEKGAQ